MTFSPVMSDSRAWCSSPFPSHRASICPKTVSMVTWPARLDTERRYLPTKVIPIYLLTFLHAFELLGWEELGQATGAHSVTWIQSYNCWSSDLAAQRLLRFNSQCHHIPHLKYSGTSLHNNLAKKRICMMIRFCDRYSDSRNSDSNGWFSLDDVWVPASQTISCKTMILTPVSYTHLTLPTKA